IPAQEILQEVLEQFEGTILLVSHDRYLIDRLATQIWSLQDGVLTVFKGTYQEYLAAQKAAKENPTPAAPKVEPRPERTRKPSNGKKNEALTKLELQIHSVESSLKEIDLLLQRASAAQKVSTVEALGREYAEQQRVMDEL